VTTASHGPLVLIVDDNEWNLRLARDVLSAAGMETLEATSADAAIALAAARLPDVILLDLGLPDMDGADAARRLRDEARTARIRLVALSAQPLEEYGDRLLEAGFDGVLEKPIDVAEFPGQVRLYCAEGRA
jgi:two-component system, cell cycle response regulator DivK